MGNPSALGYSSLTNREGILKLCFNEQHSTFPCHFQLNTSNELFETHQESKQGDRREGRPGETHGKRKCECQQHGVKASDTAER